MKLSEIINGCHVAASLNFSGVLGEAAEKHAEEKRKKLLDRVGGLIDTFSESLERAVQDLRDVRRVEKAKAQYVKDVDRAFKFFAETGNPLPMMCVSGQRILACDLCRSVGIDVPDFDSDEWNVPKDWEPSA